MDFDYMVVHPAVSVNGRFNHEVTVYQSVHPMTFAVSFLFVALFILGLKWKETTTDLKCFSQVSLHTI